MVYHEACRGHAETFGPASQADGACGNTEHDDSRIEDFAPDIGGLHMRRRTRSCPWSGDGAGCGAVDTESTPGEATEEASAGTAEVIAQPSRRELSYLRWLCSRLLSKPPPL